MSLYLVSLVASILGASTAIVAVILKTMIRGSHPEASNGLTPGTRMPRGVFPRVRDVSDPITLGTHQAHSGGTGRFENTDQLPPYVLRDADAALRKALEVPGFVLVTGAAAVGKTRSAFEAIRTVLPDHILIAPSSPEDMSAAVEAAIATRVSVLWLDDLEPYLESGRLTPSQIDEVLAGPNHHRVIVATLRSSESWLTSSSPDSNIVLAKAKHVSLGRVFSVEEQSRARSLDDARIAAALAHADTYSVGEYLASGPRPQRTQESAPPRRPHPSGAELIAAVVADIPTSKAVAELLALSARDAASIINRCNTAVGADLLSAMAIPERRADTAWKLLQMIPRHRQSQLLQHMSSTAVAALLALPPPEEAAAVVKRQDIQTVVAAFAEMAPDRAARLVMAMDMNRVTEVFVRTSPKRIADILRNIPRDAQRQQLLIGLPENFRASALRYLSGGT